MPSLTRSWITRSSSPSPAGAGIACRRAAVASALRFERAGSATVPPRDRDTEPDLKKSEAERHVEIAPRGGREERECAHGHEGVTKRRDQGHAARAGGEH